MFHGIAGGGIRGVHQDGKSCRSSEQVFDDIQSGASVHARSSRGLQDIEVVVQSHQGDVVERFVNQPDAVPGRLRESKFELGESIGEDIPEYVSTVRIIFQYDDSHQTASRSACGSDHREFESIQQCTDVCRRPERIGPLQTRSTWATRVFDVNHRLYSSFAII
jgi:hypothetical protein